MQLLTIGQARFLKEIAKYNYNKDEAIAEAIGKDNIIDNKKYEMIKLYFDECNTDAERKDLINLLAR